MTSSPIRVLSVDDHPLFQEGLATVIEREPDMLVIAKAATCLDAIRQFRKAGPDVTLMDVSLPDKNGVAAINAIRAEFRDARIVILTTFEGDAFINAAFQAGARSYVLKSTPPREIMNIVRQVHAGKKHIPPEIAAKIAESFGEPKLTNREIDVLQHSATGNRSQAIGEKLFISTDTVKVHIRNIMGKLGARDRTEAVVIAARRGIIQL